MPAVPAVIGAVGAIGGALISSSGASSAASAQADAANNATQIEFAMWQKAQEDFAPYLEAGVTKGLPVLTQEMPSYINNVLTPVASQIANFSSVPYPSASTGMVNPVTGEVTQATPSTLSAPRPSVTQTAGSAPYQPLSSPARTAQTVTGPTNQTWEAASSAPATNTGTSTQSTSPYNFSSGSFLGRVTQNIPATSAESSGNGLGFNNGGMLSNTVIPAITAGANAATSTTYNQPYLSTQATQQYPTTSAGATTDQLAQGGVLSPLTPTLPGSLSESQINNVASAPTLEGKLSQDIISNYPTDFTWNPDDPVYQYKLGQAEDAQKKYLASIGMTNSSPALAAMRDTGLAVAAEDIDKQYARAVDAANTQYSREAAERNAANQAAYQTYGMSADEANTLFGRQQSERNYLAQALQNQYGMDASRGETLYNRQYQAGQDLRNNLLSERQNTLNDLLNSYNSLSDLYAKQYGAGYDLANIGTNTASASGSSALQTGQLIGSNINNAGAAQASGQLASSGTMANLATTLPYLATQAYQAYQAPTTYNYNANGINPNSYNSLYGIGTY